MRDLRFWRWRAAQDDDVDRELELHLDLAAAERRQNGLPSGEAQRAARKEFGSLALAKEELREMRRGAAVGRLLSQASRDVRYGLRLMARAPGFSVAAVLILALSIAADAAMFSLVDTLLLRSGPGRMDSLVALFSRDRQKPDSYRDFSYPLYVDLRDRGAISVLYRVSPLDLAALSGAVVVLGAATLLACYIPARRATRIASLTALRTE
jgi:hypothetical protein